MMIMLVMMMTMMIIWMTVVGYPCWWWWQWSRSLEWIPMEKKETAVPYLVMMWHGVEIFVIRLSPTRHSFYRHSAISTVFSSFCDRSVDGFSSWDLQLFWCLVLLCFSWIFWGWVVLTVFVARSFRQAFYSII